MALTMSTNDVARQLYNLNRQYNGEQTWRKLYQDVSINSQLAQSQLSYDYGSAMNEAYLASLQQANAISGSNLGQGYKERLLEDNQAALEEAFNSYRANYQSNLATISQETATANQAITDELTEQAERTNLMSEKPYEYLQYLYNTYGEGDDKENIFLTEDNWRKYTYTDEDGETHLKTKEMLLHGDGSDDFQSFYDKDGNITLAGADFYDQMLNEFGPIRVGKGLSFSEWLKENDTELFEWASSANAYDYSDKGTNFGSFKTLFGMTSTDETYAFIERFGGLSEQRLTAKFDNFAEKFNDIKVKYSDSNGNFKGDKSQAYIEETELVVNDLINVAEELGLDVGGIDKDALLTSVQEAYNKNTTEGENWGAGLALVGTGIVSGAASGAGVGSAAAGVGAVPGAIVGAIVGLAVGIVGAIASTTTRNDSNKNVMTELHNKYIEAVGQLTQYAITQREQKALALPKYRK